MKNFIILSIILASVLLAVALLLDNIMAIFIVSTLVCIFMNMMVHERNHKNPNE